MKKIRNNRNPRYQEALNLAEENNQLLKDNNFQNVLAVSNLESEVTRIKGYLERLAGNIIPRNEKLTDAYLKLTCRYTDMVSLLRTREDRLDLLERELKICNPDHWLVAEDDSEENADAAEEDEPEPESKQLEFDFGPEFMEYELKYRKKH
jgi:hypothetical protein|tara:strand:- start:322 stop:774 length:453 start_codon:yes stop_codon:yes gene_type:complete